MDTYIKTIINGLKTWVASCLSRLESSVSGNLATMADKLTSLSTKVQKNTTDIAQLQAYEDETNALANQAQTTAQSAQTTAQSAQTTAQSAQTTAQSAQTTAQSAQTTAQRAEATANQAQTTANDAQSTASGAVKKAGDTMTGQLVCRDLVLGPSSNAAFSIQASADSYTKFGDLIFRNPSETAAISFAVTSGRVRINGISKPYYAYEAANKEYVDEKTKLTYPGSALFFYLHPSGTTPLELPIDADAIKDRSAVFVIVTESNNIQTEITSVTDANGVELNIADGSITLEGTCVLNAVKTNSAISVRKVASL